MRNTDDVGREQEIAYLDKETALLRAKTNNAMARRRLREERYPALWLAVPVSIVAMLITVIVLLARHAT